MPATRLNYLVAWKGLSQIYGSAQKEKALETPPPEGMTIEDKMVFFVSWEPDNEELIVRQVPASEVLAAEIVLPKKKES